MAIVWLMDIPALDKIVMLKLADCAHDDGGQVYPGVETVARQCGVAARSVQRTIARYLDAGLLVLEHEANRARHWPRIYRFDVRALMAHRQVSPGDGVAPGKATIGLHRPGDTQSPGFPRRRATRSHPTHQRNHQENHQRADARGRLWTSRTEEGSAGRRASAASASSI